MSNSESLPANWVLSTLEEVAISAGGGTPPKDDPTYWNNGTIPWISPKDMKSFILQSSQDHVSESALGRLTLVPKNSVLAVVRSGILSHTFPVALNAEAGTINQDMRAFIPETGVNARYLAWQLVASGNDILRKCSKHGTTVASIEGPALARFPLTIAPANEQSRIVEKLEELLSDLDAGVAELKAAQKKLAQYRQSLLKAAVEGALTAEWRKHNPPQETGAQLLERILKERRARWEAKQLAKFAEQGKAPLKGWQEKYVEPVKLDTTELPELPKGWVWAKVRQTGDVQLGRQRAPQFHTGPNMVPYLRVANVFEDRIDVTDVMEMHFSEEEEKIFGLQFNDILLNEGQSLELIGRPAIYRNELPKACFTNTLVRYRAEDGVVPEYALILFLHYMHSGRFRKIATITTNIAHLGAGRFAEIEFPLPSTAEQTEIVNLFSEQIAKIRDQQMALQHSLKQSTAQRKNILKAAFAGQLVPQDPNDEPASVLLERIRAERAARDKQPKPRKTRAVREAA